MEAVRGRRGWKAAAGLGLLLAAAQAAGCRERRALPTGRADGAADAWSRPGGSAYLLRCAPCHLESGEGKRGAGPPLAGSEWVSGPPERLAAIVLHGLRGPVEVQGEIYDLLMPPLGFLADEEIASILTFVRSAWGNRGGPVEAAQVARVREAGAGRSEPWTAEEVSAAWGTD